VKQGKSEFKMSINGQDYNILLDPDLTTGKQQNMNTGRPRAIRLFSPPDMSNQPSTNERMSPARSASRPLGPPPTGSMIGVIPTSPGKLQEASAINKLRISVWLSGDWHPISVAQDRQIKDALLAGKTIFEVTEGAFRFTIDTTGKAGWVQIGSKRTRKMKVEVDAEKALVRQSSRDVLSSLIDTVKQEWKHVAGGKAKMTNKEMVSSWSGACKDAGVQDVALLEQTALDIFNRIDVSRNGYIEEYEWLHYKLLELQAPSFHSLAQVNEKVLQWEKERSGVCAELLQVFVKSGGGDADARITATAMKKIAQEWSQNHHRSTAKAPSKKAGPAGPGAPTPELIGDVSRRYLEDLLRGQPALEEDLPITYYDFMNHMLGRRKTVVQLYKYDLSNGKAWWLSPLLLGQHFEGIWHTGIVVHGKEYWFGGNIFETPPATSPFGQPAQIVELPEFTMRTREDLWNFISRELASEFTKANYDVLTHNCNHFSDAVSVFLLSEHIPDDVLKQPEMVMNSITVQTLRPLLNRWLGNFGDESADASGRKTDEDVAKDEWAQLESDSLIVYEYKPGWTCVARLVQKDGETCTIRRVNAGSKALLIEEGVSRTMVSRLPTSGARAPRTGSKGAGGILGTCMRPSAR